MMMQARRWVWLAVVLAGVCCAGLGGPAWGEVESRLSNHLATADLRGTAVSVCVVDVTRGEVLAEIEADRAMIPASNMKLVTTAAALGVLGEDFRFTTRLDLLPTGLDGAGGPALVVTGDGDPAFGDPSTLDAAGYTVDDLVGWWVDAVVATGRTRFEQLIIDDRIFANGEDERVHPSWPRNQLHKRYCAQVMGVNFFNNVFQVTASPTRMGEDVQLAVYPYGPFVRTDLRVRTGRVDQWDIITSADSNQITFRGQLKHQQRQYVSMHDPAMVFGELLKQELGRAGVTVGEVVRPGAEERLPVGERLHQVNTTLQAVLTRTNRDSMNLYAEALLKRSGFELTGAPGSFENGSAAVRRFLADTLDDPTLAASIRVADGSGMSRDNRVTARALAMLLDAMHGHAAFGPYLASLGQPGDGGTLDRRFVGVALEGRVFAKSGYINGVSSLSGYLVYPPAPGTVAGSVRGSGHRFVAFSILCNGFGEGNARELSNRDMKLLQEQLVALIDEEIAIAAPRR